MLGARAIAPEVVWHSLAGNLQGPDSTIILQARLPRTLAGILVGMALGAAGAVMQALTRSPTPAFSASTPAPALPSCWASVSLASPVWPRGWGSPGSAYWRPA